MRNALRYDDNRVISRLRLHHRQQHGDARSLALNAADIQPPAMALDNMFDDGKAEAGAAHRAAATRIDAIETLGQPGELFWRDALALIGDAQFGHTRAARRQPDLHLRVRMTVFQGIADNIVRLSVGIENIEDLIADLGQAMAKVR